MLNFLCQSRVQFNHPLIAKEIGAVALSAAAGAGHIDIVENLLKAGVDVNGPKGRLLPDDKTDKSPLLAAVVKGRAEIVKILLDHKADVSIYRREIVLSPGGDAPRSDGSYVFTVDYGRGRNALMLAVEEGHTDIAQILLDRGADPNQTSALEGAWSPSHGIRNFAGKGTVIRTNVQPYREVKATPLQIAACLGNKEVVRALLKHGADVNPKDVGNDWFKLAMGTLNYVPQSILVSLTPSCTYGDPLFGAAMKGDTDIVQQLLAAGAGHRSPGLVVA